MKLIKTVPGFKPLCYLDDGLLLSSGFRLFKADFLLQNVRYLCSVPAPLWARTATSSRLLARLGRLELGPATRVGGSTVLIFAKRCCYRLDLESGVLTQEMVLERGSRPLMIEDVNLSQFEAGAYFGEYLDNPGYGPVDVFHRNADGKWKTVFTFPKGEINHVHGIYQDEVEQCLYILTGDFHQGAAFWRTDDGFRSVRRVLSGNQQARACWLRRVSGRLMFASDTQKEFNHLYLVSGPSLAEQTPPQRMFPINGSSIYHHHDTRDGIVFSTAVEPAGESKGWLRAMLTRRPGPGIVGDHACIYTGDPQRGFSLALQARKDRYPFRLFQFGAFQFPTGSAVDAAGLMHAYGVAVEGYDNHVLIFERTGSK